jgi:large subunit ribosomal protein L10
VDRAEKKEAVATLHEVFSKTSVVVVAQYSGLTVAQMQRLRKQMRQAGAHVQVAKNRLAQIALKGTDVASIGPLLKGPTLIAHSTLPSLDELRAKLLGLLAAPATKLAQLANAPAAKVARVVAAYAAKDAA